MNLRHAPGYTETPLLLAAFAHPDDESCRAGGTLAGFAASGVRVILVTATAGEAGVTCCLSESDLEQPLGNTRKTELACAAVALGISNVIHLDLPDGGLGELNENLLATEFLIQFLHHNPSLVLTFNPTESKEHPDHRAVGRASTRAAQAVGASLLYTVREPELAIDRNLFEIGITPWTDQKRTAMSCHTSQFDCWHDLEEALDQGDNLVERYRLIGDQPPSWLHNLKVQKNRIYGYQDEYAQSASPALSQNFPLPGG